MITQQTRGQVNFIKVKDVKPGVKKDVKKNVSEDHKQMISTLHINDTGSSLSEGQDHLNNDINEQEQFSGRLAHNIMTQNGSSKS